MYCAVESLLCGRSLLHSEVDEKVTAGFFIDDRYNKGDWPSLDRGWSRYTGSMGAVHLSYRRGMVGRGRGVWYVGWWRGASYAA